MASVDTDARREDGVTERSPQYVLDLGGNALASIVHREEVAEHVAGDAQALMDAAERLAEQLEPEDGQILARDRDDYVIGGDQGVERDQAEVGRRIDDDVIVCAQRRGEQAPQQVLTGHGRGELKIDSGEGFARGRERKALDAGLAHDLLDGLSADETLGHGRLASRKRARQRGGGAALEIEIDEEHALAAHGQSRRQIHRRCGLADAAFLIGNAENRHAPTLGPPRDAVNFLPFFSPRRTRGALNSGAVALQQIILAIAVAQAEAARGLLFDEDLVFEERDGETLERAEPGELRLVVYAASQEVEELHRRLEARLEAGGIAARFSFAAVADDWRDAWKTHFRPRAVGPFVLVPSWEAYAPQAGETVIDLDPGRAFGTGGHASTRLCLRCLGRQATARRFFDVGCGSGVLAIACAKRWPAAGGLAIDVDGEAVETTQENAEKNGVAGRIVASTTPLEQVPGKFDLVLANLSAPTLTQLVAHLLAHVEPGGRLIASGVLTAEAEALAAVFARAGAKLVDDEREDEWTALVWTPGIES